MTKLEGPGGRGVGLRSRGELLGFILSIVGNKGEVINPFLYF